MSYPIPNNVRTPHGTVIGYSSMMDMLMGQRARSKLGFLEAHADHVFAALSQLEQAMRKHGFVWKLAGISRREAGARSIVLHEPTGYTLRLSVLGPPIWEPKTQYPKLHIDTVPDKRISNSADAIVESLLITPSVTPKAIDALLGIMSSRMTEKYEGRTC